MVALSSEGLISFVFQNIKFLDLSCVFVEGMHYCPAPQSERSTHSRPDPRPVTRSLPLISLCSAFYPSSNLAQAFNYLRFFTSPGEGCPT